LCPFLEGGCVMVEWERAREVHARVAARVREELAASSSSSGVGHEDGTLRILVATDQHLGYKEEDEVRREDAFAALEECCELAETMEADLMLFAGDLFHSNNPSRWCLTRCIEILRRHCVGGPREVGFDVLNDEGVTSRAGREVGRRCSHLDPSLGSSALRPTGIPCFAIHGNHDDPGGTDNLSALDVLSAAGVLNYFGKLMVEGEEDGQSEGRVKVRPVLLQKGDTKVALYGMGNIRDERLARLMFNHKVTYRQPQVDRDDYFNLLALHQNRVNRGYQYVQGGPSKGRGGSAATINSVAEEWLPSFVDFVVWGHEHECIAEPWQSHAEGTEDGAHKGFYVTQPGSTVATSLVEGESRPKHCLLLEVRGIDFRCSALPLRSVRPFRYGHVVLSDVRDPGPLDPDDAPAIERYLERRVRAMIQDADDAWNYEHEGEDVDSSRTAGRRRGTEAAADAGRSGRTGAATKRRRGGGGRAEAGEVPEEAEGPRGPLPLIRLRVDYTGHTAINSQRFGVRFVGKVANPQDLLTFTRRRVVPPRKGAAGGDADVAMREVGGDDFGRGAHRESDDLRPDDLDERLIDVLVKENLRGKGLGLLPEEEMLAAVDSYVHKGEPNAIRDLVDSVLKKVGDGLEKCSRIEKPEDVTVEIARFIERRRHERELGNNADPTLGAPAAAEAGLGAAAVDDADERRPLPSQRPAGSQVVPDADAENVLRRYGGLVSQSVSRSIRPAASRPAGAQGDGGGSTTPRSAMTHAARGGEEVVRSTTSPGNTSLSGLAGAGSQATRASHAATRGGHPRARRGGGGGARAKTRTGAEAISDEGLVLPSLDTAIFHAPTHPAESAVDLISDDDDMHDNDDGTPRRRTTRGTIYD